MLLLPWIYIPRTGNYCPPTKHKWTIPKWHSQGVIITAKGIYLWPGIHTYTFNMAKQYKHHPPTTTHQRTTSHGTMTMQTSIIQATKSFIVLSLRHLPRNWTEHDRISIPGGLVDWSGEQPFFCVANYALTRRRGCRGQGVTDWLNNNNKIASECPWQDIFSSPLVRAFLVILRSTFISTISIQNHPLIQRWWWWRFLSGQFKMECQSLSCPVSLSQKRFKFDL